MLFEALTSSLVGSIADKSWSAVLATKEAKLFRKAARQRLARELRLNNSILNLTQDKDSNDWVELLASEAVDQVCTLDLPLELILSNSEISSKGLDKLVCAREKSKQVANWSKEIRSEIDLLERVWLRLRVLKVRQKLGGNLGNLKYLATLQRVLEISLSQTDEGV